MIVETTKDIRFINAEIRKGKRLQVLTKGDMRNLDPEQAGLIKRAKRRYEEMGKQGLFVRHDGMWRWLDEGDYRRI